MSMYDKMQLSCNACNKRLGTDAEVYNITEPIEVITESGEAVLVEEGFVSFCSICMPERFRKKVELDNRYNTD